MIEIDDDSGTPPYEQIRSQIAEGANSGGMPVGTKLPTVRGLAADLGVAPGTVARAYTELERAGVIETRGRKGTFVAAGGDAQRDKAAQAAAAYAREVTAYGIDADEAVALVTAALDAGGVRTSAPQHVR
ncbi:GntR family transcriptional regulator [Calidifontibacter sp. DB0510]|uniref:GntR family transcriptional regulator n=1 Tax=Metallococcus carri TaxID=1656884 RepID=A0A967B434_9MICO|nr:GntR family transcriptional regulator [Metallococcus carri]NHN54221.1 GntR family transcriptional regulator [Metallococcus carri]NOP36939.1 GntR family transcriptional regulator [Calidifontibacter sp. DB2511S]